MHFDRNTEYNAENCDVENVILYDENTGMEYLLKENSRIALSVPVGIPLTVAALEALLLAGGVVIIAGIAYTIVEEVALALKRQKQYKYYSAVLRNDAVYVGNALSDKSAKALAYTNDENGTVLATSYSYAIGLVGNSFEGPENHGSSSGYWYHIHAKAGVNSRHKAHVWYLQ